jgi:hypothetical protein
MAQSQLAAVCPPRYHLSLRLQPPAKSCSRGTVVSADQIHLCWLMLI